MKKPIIIICILFITILALALVQIGLSNQIATEGTEMAILDEQIDTYQKQNILLEQQLLQASSLTTIAAKAKRLGFVSQNGAIDLSSPLPLALKQ